MRDTIDSNKNVFTQKCASKGFKLIYCMTSKPKSILKDLNIHQFLPCRELSQFIQFNSKSIQFSRTVKSFYLNGWKPKKNYWKFKIDASKKATLLLYLGK